ncbi:hypothetical protein SO802_004859 [Lithocarpus litseifolius]|uniref:DUF4283 domain-containing protein n=1 Tax=Lithocarpus litseifolius TaxID=425828 RepID=A0AAW2DL29_9ROSI
MEAITSKCVNLKLSEREGSEVDLALPGVDQGLVLAGKFCTKRRVNLEAAGRALRSVWRIKKDFEVSDMGENRVLFLFRDKEDLDRVLLQGPWSFDKYILLLHKLEVGESVTSLLFHKAAFWVQIHGLPTLSQTREASLRIGGSLGKVERVDVGDKGFSLGYYLRIRVTMDISQPLCRGRMVRLGGSEARWVEFKYERLSVFCYLCVKIDHDEKDCIDWIRSADAITLKDKQYGSWLRAVPDRLQKPPVVLVQREWESDRHGQPGEKQAAREQQDPPQTADSARRSPASAKLATNHEEADVEGLIVESARIKEKMTGCNGKCDFKNQLREIDAEISGNADMGCNVDIADSERFRENIKTIEHHKETLGKGDLLQRLGYGLLCNGLQAVTGQNENHVISNDPKANLTQMQDLQAFHVGPTNLALNGKGSNKSCKSPTRGRPQAHATTSGKGKVGLRIPTGQKESAKEDVNRMEVEEMNLGPKRKLQAPLSEVKDNMEVGKKIKLDEEVDEMAEIKSKLKRRQCMIVPSVRRSGGLVLFWKDSLSVDVQTYSPNHIDAVITEEDGNKKWRFTGLYGHPKTSKREESWRLLVNLSTRSDLPWVCMGDFNEIRHRGEKEGGGDRPEWQMRAFSLAINKSKLRDMGCVGPEFYLEQTIGCSWTGS